MPMLRWCQENRPDILEICREQNCPCECDGCEKDYSAFRQEFAKPFGAEPGDDDQDPNDPNDDRGCNDYLRTLKHDSYSTTATLGVQGGAPTANADSREAGWYQEHAGLFDREQFIVPAQRSSTTPLVEPIPRCRRPCPQFVERWTPHGPVTGLCRHPCCRAIGHYDPCNCLSGHHEKITRKEKLNANFMIDSYRLHQSSNYWLIASPLT